MAKDRESRPLKKPLGRRAAGLSEEERALWEHTARGLKPLKKGKQRIHGAHEEAVATARALREPEKARAQPISPAPQPAETAKAPPALADLDRRKARQIGAGRIDIEARVDLHGLRQSEAHTALRRFLLKAHADGRRWVLVITGKGAPRAGEAAAEGFGAREEERGVLKRNVPRWLAEPELRSIVVGFATAAVRHGGEGALYVQLRRKGR
jgi:DNA-nicking Smr family endonuclease